MFKKIEHTAWLILTLAFLSCIALAIGVPMGARWYLSNARRPLDILLQPRSGAVSYRMPGDSTASITSETTELRRRSQIDQTNGADALLYFYHPDRTETPVVTVQLYGRTNTTLSRAQTPRFEASQHPHQIEMQVTSASNMWVSVTGNSRDVDLKVHTPQGTIHLENGTFKLIVSEAQTDLTVIDGQAQVPDPDSTDHLVLTRSQRTQLTAEGLGEITIGERNILRNLNGDFEEPLESTWRIYTDKFKEDENGGTVKQRRINESRQVVFLTRVGQHWAETGITQDINQDIRGAKSLFVRARIRVDAHTLPVCGSVGTECPIMIRLNFIDQNTSRSREWLQGFYSVVGNGSNEPFCPSCEWKAEHVQVPLGVWYDYESPDLLPLLQEEDFDPEVIASIEVYASGHTYGSAVDEVAILVGE